MFIRQKSMEQTDATVKGIRTESNRLEFKAKRLTTERPSITHKRRTCSRLRKTSSCLVEHRSTPSDRLERVVKIVRESMP
jgi:hypothetical protein